MMMMTMMMFKSGSVKYR